MTTEDAKILTDLYRYIQIQPNMKNEKGEPLTLPLIKAYDRLLFFVKQDEDARK